jgi:YebC/PmpR family DNA-binding regulatory protein
MPNDNINKNIKKASGNLLAVNYENITYEGYGPNGVAILVETLTDNRNRTVANVRSAFTKGGGNMGANGCVSFIFDKKGIILIEKNDTIDEEELLTLSLDAGVSDFLSQPEGFEIVTTPSTFSNVVDLFIKNNIPILSSELIMLPNTYTSILQEDDTKKMTKLLDLLEDDDDVQNVWHNLN